MPGIYPDHASRVEDYTAKRTLGQVLLDRAQDYLQLPTELEVIEHFGLTRPSLNTMADFHEWNRRIKRLKMQMVQERMGNAPDAVSEGRYAVR